MFNKKILIVGCGIAGPTLAFWLKRYGFEPTLIERATSPRQGGYVTDLWGNGYDIAENMGLLPRLRERALPIDDVKLVDGKGRRAGGFAADIFGTITGDRHLSILRSDLAAELLEPLDDVRILYGETVSALDENDEGVYVEFHRHPPEQFDLVVGAGGQHSPVRHLVFGAESQFSKFLGYHAAAFSTDDYPHCDPHAYVSYSVPGHQVSRYTLRGGRTVFLLVFSSETPLEVLPQDFARQKEALVQEFSGVGWECPLILSRLQVASDIYFDSVSQIRMPHLTRHRVALVGDACGCPSLLSGQGSTLAMAGAYILAGELQRARGDYLSAFARYERKLLPAIECKQRAAEKFAKSLVPETRLGVFFRNRMTHLMRIPAVANYAMGSMRRDSLEMPNYPVN